MGAVVLLLIVIGASLVCVRAGAIALELTGMDRVSARFQALSAFTNTGFTTREAEEIIRVPTRRKIITALIILGHAGTVSVVATFATSLFQRNFLSTALNVGIILAGLFVLFRLASLRGLTERIGEAIRRWLLARYHLRAPSLEEMLLVAEGFGVVRVTVPTGCRLTGRTLVELNLKAAKIQILSIIRGETTITIPQGSEILSPGDILICYGDEQAITELFADGRAAATSPGA